MQLLSSLGLITLVAGAAFVVLAVLVSHLRYQKCLWLAEQEAEGVLAPDSAAFILLDDVRSEPRTYLHFVSGDGFSDEVIQIVKSGVRKSDRVWHIEGGSLLVVLACPPEHLPSVNRRLTGALISQGISGGIVRMGLAESDPEPILNLLRSTPESMVDSEWKVEPDEWPFTEEEPLESILVDELTGVLREDYAPRAFRGLLANKKRRNQPLALFRIDVDRLISYNETSLQRKGGDAVLKRVADVLMNSCREDDLIARLEEDQFLIATAVDPASIPEIANRFCERVKNEVLTVEDETFRFTVSLGYACFPDDGQTPTGLFERAGIALGEAKLRGRGVGLAFDPSMTKTTVRESRVASDAPEEF